MIEQISALIILSVIGILSAYVVSRLTQEQLKEILLIHNIVIITGGLFCLLLVVQLIKEQTFMPDLLKFVGGVIAGASVANKGGQVAVGKKIQQAARDINNIQKQLGTMLNQYSLSSNEKTIQQPPVVVCQEYEKIKIDYNSDIIEEYRRVYQDNPDTLKYKPSGEKEIREWYDRRISFFSNIPGANERLNAKVTEIRDAGWEIEEISFDFSNSSVAVIFKTIRQISLDTLTN